MIAVTIVRTNQHARHLGAKGANGMEKMPDGSWAVSLRSLRNGAVRGIDISSITLADGVVLTAVDREELGPAVILSGVTVP